MSTALLNETKGAVTAPPSPARFFQVMHAYQQTAALKAAIELDLFTAIGEGLGSVALLAKRIKASERGTRALCDFLVVMGFVTKAGEFYGLTPDSSFFLDKNSQAYIGGATRFLASPDITSAYNNFADIVRSGGPRPNADIGSGERLVWVDFARGMGPMSRVVAELTERVIHSTSEVKVLDLAASHGMYGIAVARHNPKARIVAADWPSVLAVAKENAERAGVADRLTLLPGDLLKVPFGTGFDVVLIPNLLHMWDRATINVMLKKIHGALAPNGRIVIVEFVANDDRVSPAGAASFIMNMVANTAGGNVYTSSEYREMLAESGFTGFQATPLPPAEHTAIVAVRR